METTDILARRQKAALCSILCLTLGILAGSSAERTFDFSAVRENQPPNGFRSAVTGEGKPGDWRVIADEVPPLLPRLSPQAPVVSTRAVLAQVSQDPTDEHFPLLIFEGDTYADFTFTARFKTVRGTQEQMAGIAFRIQDEANYYVLRASSLGGTFRFYKIVNGQRGQPIGQNIQIPGGIWHEIGVECKGNQIRCFLNGTHAIPTLSDSSFSNGKVGFWTKSDSVSYFADAKVVYTPREPPAQSLVRSMCDKYDRLIGMQVYVTGKEPATTRMVGSKDSKEVGKSGGEAEWDVIKNGTTYYGKERKSVSVVMPLRDQNGEIIAAVRVIMTTFTGQTEKNAIERAAPIVREMQKRITRLQDLVE